MYSCLFTCLQSNKDNSSFLWILTCLTCEQDLLRNGNVLAFNVLSSFVQLAKDVNMKGATMLILVHHGLPIPEGAATVTIVSLSLTV